MNEFYEKAIERLRDDKGLSGNKERAMAPAVREALEKFCEEDGEFAQPESEFLLRVDSEKGIAFFEADGGIWRLEAKRNIAEYFERGLKDLIEQGKVVIMQ